MNFRSLEKAVFSLLANAEKTVFLKLVFQLINVYFDLPCSLQICYRINQLALIHVKLVSFKAVKNRNNKLATVLLVVYLF